METRFRLSPSSFTGRLVYTAILLLVSALPLQAGEPYGEFLRALYDRGYGDAALDYLKIISERKDLPEDIRATLDLETANALRVAARETQNADESAARLASAQEHLDKFLKEHADNPRAAAAYVTYGDLASTLGDNMLRLALLQKQEKDKPPSPLYTEARMALEQARPKYQKAVELYGEQYKALAAAAQAAAAQAEEATPAKTVRRPTRVRSAANAAPTPQQIVEDLWIEARFKLAMLDYNIGRTYLLPTPLNIKLPEHKKIAALRKASLDGAAKDFDSIYQPNRTLRTGLYAHMWEGKVREEEGELLTAQDIYEEVLANEPPPGTKINLAFEALFVEVHQFRFNILLKQDKVDEVIEEAEQWTKDYKRMDRTPGYQGIVLQLAKALIAKAEKAKPAEQKTLYKDALGLLADAIKIRSPYEAELRLVRIAVLEKAGRSTGEENFGDALAIADQAASTEQWEDAIAGYKKAIELGKKSKDPADAQKVIAARFQLARSEYLAAKLVESLNDAYALAKELGGVKGDKTGPPAASLAVNAAMNLYIMSQGKPDELKRLQEVADFTIKTWPERAESDDARIAMGKVDLVQGRFAEATKVFEGVNPSSDRYPNALYLAAQTHFRLYLMEKQKGDQQDPQVLTAQRAKTVQELVASIDAERKTVPKNQPMPKSLLDTMLLLGEVYLEGGEGSLAVPVLDPIFVSMQAQKPKGLDSFTLRVCLAAVKSYMAVKDLNKAESVATLLMNVGADEPRVNLTLIEFLKSVKFEWKQAMAAVIQNPKNAEAKKSADENGKLLGTLLVKMSTRKELSLGSMVFLADSCFDVSKKDSAGELYQGILKRAEADPAWLGPNKNALIRVRAQLIGLLRSDKKYEQALGEVDKLIEATGGKSLDALMERGRILQGWAEQDSARLSDAVDHWADLRVKLQSMRKKPPEYFEVLYNTAFCLVEEAKATGDRTKAGDAVKMLTSALILSPKLTGPDMVAKYKVLLEQAREISGLGKAQPAATAGAAAPAGGQ